MNNQLRFLMAIGIITGMIGCSETETRDTTGSAAVTSPQSAASNAPQAGSDIVPTTLPNSVFQPTGERITVSPNANARRKAYFGDLHVHTTYSFDAFAFGTLATPYDAYRYARGEAIKHPAGFDVQLRQPLDFYAVTDHAMFMGMVGAAADTSTEFSKLELAQSIHNLNAPENLNTDSIARRIQTFTTFIPKALQGMANGSIDLGMAFDITRSAWSDTVKAAEEFNDPGNFTTFVAYEYTSSSNDRGNLHRNVIFRGADKLPAIPFSRFHSQNPEGLWDWMDGLREQGIEALAIPHNSNGSNGQMFKLTDWAGNPMDNEYARQRMRNEPLVEVTQIKGTSDTHPALSMTDEWADFEIMPYRIATVLPSEPNGSYVRQAYLRGLAMQAKGNSNPYKFGLIGSSDTHTGATSDDESNYFAKIGILDSTAALRGSVPATDEQAAALRAAGASNLVSSDSGDYITGASQTFGASGLAAVWAEENTRDAIYNAFRRKETFATSGPRMRVRFFAGLDFGGDLMDSKGWVTEAYAKGVTMGSDLITNKGDTPTFLVWASRDPNGAALQRLQVIKGYTVDGEHFENVYDVACSDGLSVDSNTHRCPDNGAKVNLADCSITANTGASELQAAWQDPDYNAGHEAFYYVRVLENPTCRWSTWDAIRAGVPPRPGLKKTIQERAWSSPIWLTPAG